MTQMLLLAALAVAIALLVVTSVRAERRAARQDAQEARRGPIPPPTGVQARLAELDAQIAALTSRVASHEDDTNMRFRRLHGVIARERRGVPGQPELPAVDDGEVRPLTPALLAQLGGAAVEPTAAAASDFPPPPSARRRAWGRG